MLLNAFLRNSAWLLVQAKVMVNSTAPKPENQRLLMPGNSFASQVVSMPLWSYKNR